MSEKEARNVQGRRRAPRGQNRSRGKPQTRFVTKSSVMGGRIPLSSNPPDVTSQPWNHITLVYEATNEFQTVASIRNRLLEQLDVDGSSFYAPQFWNKPDNGNAWTNAKGKHPGSVTIQISAPTLNIKLHSIKVWNLTGRAVSLTVFDYSNASQGDEQLVGLVDTGGPNYFPAVGYAIPMTQRNFVMRTSDTKLASRNVFKTTSADQDKLVVYIRLEWKPDSKQKTFDFSLANENQIYAMLQDNHGISDDILKETRAGNQLISKVAGNQPSTIRKVIDGITTTAAVVLPIIASGRRSEGATHNDDLYTRLGNLEFMLAELFLDRKKEDDLSSVSVVDIEEDN